MRKSKSIRPDNTYHSEDPPPDKQESTEENIKIMHDFLKNPKLDNLKILNVVLQVQDEAEQ